MAKTDKKLPSVSVGNARLQFRNFSGKEGLYNREGDRNFCLLLPDDTAETMQKDGWNVKFLKPRDEEDDPQPYVQVTVKFGKYPPRITMITGNGQTVLDEDSVNVLDFAEIENVDLIINPSEWEVQGKSGVKAYLKTAYITIKEDEFAAKYYDVPDGGPATWCGGPGQPACPVDYS